MGKGVSPSQPLSWRERDTHREREGGGGGVRECACLGALGEKAATVKLYSNVGGFVCMFDYLAFLIALAEQVQTPVCVAPFSTEGQNGHSAAWIMQHL